MELEFMTCRASKMQMYTDGDVDQVDTIVMLNDADFMTDSWKREWKGIIPEATIRSFDEQIKWVQQKEHCQDYWEAVRRYKYDVLCQCFDHEWKKYKQIYELDADFAKELLQTNKGEIKIYLEEIGTLPFHCFSIDVSKLSLNVTEDEGNPKYIKSVTVLPVLYERDTAGEGWATISVEILIDYNDGGFVTDSVVLLGEDLVESEDGHHYWLISKEKIDALIMGPFSSDMSSYSYTYPWVLTVHELIFQTFVYLGSKEPDIEETKYSIKQKDRAKRLKKEEPPTHSIVGRRYGTALREHKENEEFYAAYENAHRTIASSSKRAHVVRAHYHRYWTGPKGHQKLERIWVSAYFTGSKIIDEVIHGTMKKPNGTLGEQKVKEYLDARGIKHKPQFYIPETGKRYDEAILLKKDGEDVLCFIEFDGEQHFKQVQNWDLDKTKSSDIEKNQYATDNQIPLCRIRYDQMGYISDILDGFIGAVLSGEYNSEAFYNTYISEDLYYAD